MEEKEGSSPAGFIVCVACGRDQISTDELDTHEAICKQAHLLLGEIQTAICTFAIANCKISETVKDKALGCFEMNKPIQSHSETACEGRSPIDSIEKEEKIEEKVTIRV